MLCAQCSPQGDARRDGLGQCVGMDAPEKVCVAVGHGLLRRQVGDGYGRGDGSSRVRRARGDMTG